MTSPAGTPSDPLYACSAGTWAPFVVLPQLRGPYAPV